MKRLIKLLITLFLLLLTAGLCAGVWYLFVDGRAPASRPELVRLPDDVPPPPRGFPTLNAMYAAYTLGLLDILNLNDPVRLPDGVREELDIEYGRVDGRPLLLDLYAPEHIERPVPALLFIHGGGWESGDKRDYKYYTVRFAKHGYVAATMGYRFSHEAKFPAAVQDAKCAVQWLRANAQRLHVDPEKIVVIGGSAGGHLSMMVGYTSDVAELAPNCGHAGLSSAVAGVVNLYGPTDLTVPEARVAPVVRKFLGAEFADAPELYTKVSPLHYLDAGDPPTLIIQGTLDDVVPVSQADLLAERLQQLGAFYWYDRIDGYPHTMDLALAVNERVQWLVLAWLNELFGPLPNQAMEAAQ